MSDKRDSFYLVPMSREEIESNHTHCRHYDPETPCCYCGLVDVDAGVPSETLTDLELGPPYHARLVKFRREFGRGLTS